MNFGFSGKGNTSDPTVLKDVLDSGAAGFKLHEDWGTTPSSIDAALSFAEEHDVAITIHTDTLNESGFVDDSIAAMKGRTIHTYHTEGAGGGHAPDIIKIVGEDHVLPSSTNPTRPFTINTIDEHLDMLMVCHHLDSSIPEDVAFAESRIRAETIAAEDILHDTGAISMISSDSQAMGRVGEVITRTWQTADKMKAQRGALSEDSSSGDDNFRVKRYVAKYTINPAITHGFGHMVGSVEVGKMADLVLWKPGLCTYSSTGLSRLLSTLVLTHSHAFHSRFQARDDHQGRHDRLRPDGRPECVDPDPTARQNAAHVRCDVGEPQLGGLCLAVGRGSRRR